MRRSAEQLVEDTTHEIGENGMRTMWQRGSPERDTRAGACSVTVGTSVTEGRRAKAAKNGAAALMDIKFVRFLFGHKVGDAGAASTDHSTLQMCRASCRRQVCKLSSSRAVKMASGICIGAPLLRVIQQGE